MQLDRRNLRNRESHECYCYCTTVATHGGPATAAQRPWPPGPCPGRSQFGHGPGWTLPGRENRHAGAHSGGARQLPPTLRTLAGQSTPATAAVAAATGAGRVAGLDGTHRPVAV